ncbi:MAG: HEAT repeat domain-containing protein, partial [Deltaproteobacteria bacterium]|nr:HEAT repeat domain-containing protein [Deltaproteobacteria bacterium]
IFANPTKFFSDEELHHLFSELIALGAGKITFEIADTPASSREAKALTAVAHDTGIELAPPNVHLHMATYRLRHPLPPPLGRIVFDLSDNQQEFLLFDFHGDLVFTCFVNGEHRGTVSVRPEHQERIRTLFPSEEEEEINTDPYDWAFFNQVWTEIADSKKPEERLAETERFLRSLLLHEEEIPRQLATGFILRYAHNNPNGVLQLIAPLLDGGERELEVAFQMLANMNDEPLPFRDEIVSATHHSNPVIRRRATAALSHIGSAFETEAIARLKELAADENEEVRLTAEVGLWSLGERNDAAGKKERFLSYLREPDPVSAQSIIALRGLKAMGLEAADTLPELTRLQDDLGPLMVTLTRESLLVFINSADLQGMYREALKGTIEYLSSLVLARRRAMDEYTEGEEVPAPASEEPEVLFRAEDEWIALEERLKEIIRTGRYVEAGDYEAVHLLVKKGRVEVVEILTCFLLEGGGMEDRSEFLGRVASGLMIAGFLKNLKPLATALEALVTGETFASIPLKPEEKTLLQVRAGLFLLQLCNPPPPEEKPKSSPAPTTGEPPAPNAKGFLGMELALGIASIAAFSGDGMAALGMGAALMLVGAVWQPFVSFRQREKGGTVKPAWGIAGASIPRTTRQDSSLGGIAPVIDEKDRQMRPVTITLERNDETPKLTFEEEVASLGNRTWATLKSIVDLKLLKGFCDTIVGILLDGSPVKPQFLDFFRSEVAEVLARLGAHINLMRLFAAEMELIRSLFDDESVLCRVLRNPDRNFAQIVKDRGEDSLATIYAGDGVMDKALQLKRASRFLRWFPSWSEFEGEYLDTTSPGAVDTVKRLANKESNPLSDDRKQRLAVYLKIAAVRIKIMDVIENKLRREQRLPQTILEADSRRYLSLELNRPPIELDPKPIYPSRIEGGWDVGTGVRLHLRPGFERSEFVSAELAHLVLHVGIESIQGVIEIPYYVHFVTLAREKGGVAPETYLGEYARDPKCMANLSASLKIIFRFDNNGFRTAFSLLMALTHDYEKILTFMNDPSLERAVRELRQILGDLEWAYQRMFVPTEAHTAPVVVAPRPPVPSGLRPGSPQLTAGTHSQLFATGEPRTYREARERAHGFPSPAAARFWSGRVQGRAGRSPIFSKVR